MILKGKIKPEAIVWQDFKAINFYKYYGEKFKDLVFDFTKISDNEYEGIAEGFGKRGDYGDGAIYVNTEDISFFEQEESMNKIESDLKKFCLSDKNRRGWFEISESQKFYLRKEFFRGEEALAIGNMKFETVNQFLDMVRLVLNVESKMYVLVSPVDYKFMAHELAEMGFSWTDRAIDGTIGSMYINRNQPKPELLDFKEKNA